MRICFAASLCSALAVAADSSAATVPVSNPASRTATIVKADPRSGRLIRSSVSLAPKPASTAIQSPIASTTQSITPADLVRPMTKVAERTVTPLDVPERLATSKPVNEQASAGIQLLVEEAAAKHNVDPLLVHSVIKVESNFNQFAISNKGAIGLMQLIPSTARQYGAQNSFDARQNIEAGVKYLKHLQELYKDDRLALAAYNAGEGAVAKYKWIPPYAETQNYVYQVGKKYGEARRAYEKKVLENQAATVEAAKVEPPKPEHPKLESYTDEQGRIFLRTR